MLLWAPVAAILIFSSMDSRSSQPTSQCDDDLLVSFGGDFLLHGAIWRTSKDAGDGLGLAESLSEISGIFRNSDISHVNLEGPVAEGIDYHWNASDIPSKVYTDYPRFNYRESSLKSLALTGVTVISGANNHTYDRGPEGVRKTITAAERNGILITGVRRQAESDTSFYKIVEKKGLRIAFVSCAYHLNGKNDTDDLVLGCKEEEKKLLAIVRNLVDTKSADAVIVTPHWGREGETSASKAQRRLAGKLMDAGATAVVGTHPHVLQEFEVLPQKDGTNKFVAYSLGNLLAAQGGTEHNLTAIVTLRLAKRNGRAVLSSAQVMPARIRRQGKYRLTPVPKSKWKQFRSLLRGRIHDDLLTFAPFECLNDSQGR